MDPEGRVADKRLIENLVEYWVDASNAPEAMQVAKDCIASQSRSSAGHCRRSATTRLTTN